MTTTIQMGGDEGIECIKELIYANGLAGNCWNDQPWFSTQLFRMLFWLFHGNISAVRMSVCIMAILMFICAMKQLHGRFSVGLLFCMLLLWFTTPFILNLSFSVMLEVPAFAFALASVFFISRWSQTGKTLWLIISGGLFAMAIQVKFTSAVVVPAMLSEFCFSFWYLTRHEGTRRLPIVNAGWLKNHSFSAPILAICDSPVIISSFWALLWLGVAFLTSGLLIMAAPYWNWDLLWNSHAEASRGITKAELVEYSFNPVWLRNHYWGWLSALCGIIFLIRQGRWRPLAFSSIFLITALILHWNHTPFWYYYYAHIAIPLAILGGYGVFSLVSLATGSLLVTRRGFPIKVFASGILACGLLALVFSGGGESLFRQIAELRTHSSVEKNPVIAALQRLRPKARIMYTKFSMLAFHAQIPVLPEVAVQPRKRFWSGRLDEKTLQGIIRKAQPEVLLLATGPKEPEAWAEWLTTNYLMVYDDHQFQIWALRKVFPELEGATRVDAWQNAAEGWAGQGLPDSRSKMPEMGNRSEMGQSRLIKLKLDHG